MCNTCSVQHTYLVKPKLCNIKTTNARNAIIILIPLDKCVPPVEHYQKYSMYKPKNLLLLPAITVPIPNSIKPKPVP